MTTDKTDIWQPNKAKPTLTPTLIEPILIFMETLDPEQFPDTLPKPIAENTFTITCDAEQWHSATEALDNNDIISLIQFFTLVEQHNPSWHAGEKSAVIHLCKILKKRLAFPGKELVSWIRAHSTNRFLPYGPL